MRYCNILSIQLSFWYLPSSCDDLFEVLSPTVCCYMWTIKPNPYEKVPWYNHGATMVYHGKQWYTMVQCDRTMVHPCATMVYCKRTMVHPCVTMVQAWYKKLVPWYIMVYHGTLYLYHSTSICNHMEQFLVQWYIMVYHRTSLYHHGTNILYHGMLQCTIVQPCATMVHPWHK